MVVGCRPVFEYRGFPHLPGFEADAGVFACASGCTELTVALLRLGIRPFEVPVSYYSRSHSRGTKINWREAMTCRGILLRVCAASKRRPVMTLQASKSGSTPPWFGQLVSRPSIGDLQMPNHSCRVSVREHPSRKFTFNDRARGHYRVVPDCAARQHQYSPAKPYVGANDDGSELSGMIRIDAMMIGVIYRREVANERVIADLDAVVCHNGSALVDEYPIANTESRRLRGGAKLAGQDSATHHESPTDGDSAGTIEHRESSVAGDDRRIDAASPKPGSAHRRLDVDAQWLS